MNNIFRVISDAAKRNDLQTVKEGCDDLNILLKNDYGYRSFCPHLCEVIGIGNVAAVEMLLDLPYHKNNEYGFEGTLATALSTSVEKGNVEITKVLLRHLDAVGSDFGRKSVARSLAGIFRAVAEDVNGYRRQQPLEEIAGLLIRHGADEQTARAGSENVLLEEKEKIDRQLARLKNFNPKP